MKQPTRLLVVLLLCWILTAVAATAQDGEIGWRELRYRAQKLFLSATTDVKVDLQTSAAAAPALRTPPEGRAILPSGPELAVITLDSDLPFGRREVATAWIDPGSGQVLQTEKRNLGHDLVWKLRRFTAKGFYLWRSEPRSSAEEELAPPAWTGIDNSFTSLPQKPPAGAVVTDSYALLYLLSAARLDRAGATTTVYLVSHDRLVEVTFVAKELGTERVHLDEVHGKVVNERDGSVPVRRVVSSARAIGGDGEDIDVGLMGLKDNLSLAVEVGTGIPVEISGRASGLGTVRVRLRRVVLAAAEATEPAAPSRTPTPEPPAEPGPTPTAVTTPACGPTPLPVPTTPL